MSSFEVIILGASGGPDAGATQCFMVRSTGCRDLRSICVDGGAGLGQILQLLVRTKDSSRGEVLDSFYANDFEPADQFFDPRTAVKLGFPEYIIGKLATSSDGTSSSNTNNMAFEIYNGIKEYYITHAHLDHVAAMVLNSPLACDGRDKEGKSMWGLPFTVEAIGKHIFNDRIWPDLVHSGADRIRLNGLADGVPHNCKTFPQWDIVPFKVHHGAGASPSRIRVYSTIYLFSDKTTNQSLIICGDLEPDHVSGEEPLLETAWNYIAAKVPYENLRGIIIECSSSAATNEEELYGHMSPALLISQLSKLKKTYNNPHALSGLDVVVTHVKRIISEKDPRLIILQELREAASSEKLDVRISMAVQGCTFSF